MSVLIDAKFGSKRVNVSVDAYLFQLFDQFKLGKGRANIRRLIESGDIKSSSDARYFILQSIVKPSLLAKVNNRQMDIEDF